jgi:hypothetical protein
VPENLSSGVETFMPRRLLYGLLPQTLLERCTFPQDNPYQYISLPPALPLSLALTRYTFWQDEADYLRGYAIDGSADVLYINLGIGSHVALHGASFEHIRRGDSLLAPARAVVLRLSRRAPTYHAPTLHLPTMHLPRTYHALYRVLRPSRVPSRVRLERNM